MSSEMILNIVRNTDAYVYCVKAFGIYFILQESDRDCKYYFIIIWINE